MNELLFEIANDILLRNNHKTLVKKLFNVIDIKIKNKTLQGNWHPLGFVLIKIGSVEKIGDLRLHIWSDKIRKTQSPSMPIHNHIFTVNSLILYGQITNKNYCITEGNKYRFYNIDYDGDKSILNSSEKLVDCELSSIITHCTGDFYQVNEGYFHESQVNDEGFASTLVLTTDRIEEIPITLGPIDGKDQYIYRRQPCDMKILKILISKLRNQLNQ